MFRAVLPDDVSAHWGFVLEGLEKVKSKGDVWWSPSDVKRQILLGHAWLFVRDEGFVVLERQIEPNGEPYLNVWIMWFKPMAAWKIKDELVAWLDEVAASAKWGPWRFSSPREEWAEVIAPYCERYMTTWRRK